MGPMVLQSDHKSLPLADFIGRVDGNFVVISIFAHLTGPPKGLDYFECLCPGSSSSESMFLPVTI